ncbi:MAG: hypothetical protein F6K48_28980 [Okeania sp. SIO3H1]|uniref:hypothetical protein n=1 Tax=Okeania sp. SIO1I7 TaxID=2607772 RepID=UPI0013CD6D0D|nr:hypothetical protein [Okeania sp. SIO1I7]NEN92714.1 hypothetical protein [Okeania sp. SIO3H1]NET27787.1 hypothetical protein [Okeania sp. SIO1I7]
MEILLSLLLLFLLLPIYMIVIRWIFGINLIVDRLEKIQLSLERIRKENESTKIKYDRIISQQEKIINLNAERNNRQAEMIDLLK